MGSNYKVTYGVDLVFCIDATMSMDHIIETVKDNALNFYQDFKRTMDAKNKPVIQLRVSIIAFRDYLADGSKAMMMTDFFTLPNDANLLRDAVKSVVPDGGGDDPEDGLEAVAYAIKKTQWSNVADRNRHVIVVWSDDGTHTLGFGKSSPYYPNGMAKDFDELSSWWGSKYAPGLMDEYAKRMVLFTPYNSGWKDIANNWNKVILEEVNGTEEMEQLDYSAILNTICNTI